MNTNMTFALENVAIAEANKEIGHLNERKWPIEYRCQNNQKQQ